ncbi:MAG: tyrosine-type recombinase/integrase [Hyphomonas sp.]
MKVRDKLTARAVQAAKGPALLADGAGLYLQVKATGAKSWIYRASLFGKRTEFGLGGLALLSLAQARAKRNDFARIIADGKDPREVWGRTSPSFREIALETFQARRGKWSSEGHAERWWSSLELDVMPRLGRREVADLAHGDVLAVLNPIWSKKPDTARRIAQRIRAVFDWAKAKGHYVGENPVASALVALGTQKHEVQHRAALPWQDAPAFFARLERQEGIAAAAHLFLILTASRTGEVLGARWDEIEGDVWTIPPERMKMGRAHRVPLSAAALEAIEPVRGLGGDLIFATPAKTRGPARPMTSNAFSALRGRMGVTGITTHGFRTTFRTWAADSARAPREVAELSLAHVTGSKVERAYQRSDLLEQRRELLDAWAGYLRQAGGKVVRLHR